MQFIYRWSVFECKKQWEAVPVKFGLPEGSSRSLSDWRGSVQGELGVQTPPCSLPLQPRSSCQELQLCVGSQPPKALPCELSGQLLYQSLRLRQMRYLDAKSTQYCRQLVVIYICNKSMNKDTSQHASTNNKTGIHYNNLRPQMGVLRAWYFIY